MLSAERRRAIAEIIHRKGKATVEELSAHFGVSLSTIRRDLATLAQQGLVVRAYGGALAAQRRPGEVVSAIEEQEPPAKTALPHEARRIARAAVALIAEGETIFLGPGDLTLALAHHLTSRSDLTVITNALDIACHLRQEGASPTLIVTGGQLNRPENALVGHLAHQALEELRADRAFLAGYGISPVAGLTGDQVSALAMDRALLGVADEVVLLSDHRSFGQALAVRIAPLERVDIVVTDRDTDPAIVWDLTEAGVKVILA